jgi:hypothetical protein
LHSLLLTLSLSLSLAVKNRQIIHETNTSQAEVDALGGLFNLAGDSSVSSKASSGADFGSAEKASKVAPKPVPKPPLNIQYMAHSSELLEPMILTQPDGTPRAPGVPRRARNTNNYDSSKAIKCPHCVYSSDYPGHVKSHVINIHFPERAKWHYCDVQGCGYKAKTRPVRERSVPLDSAQPLTPSSSACTLRTGRQAAQAEPARHLGQE